jgi:hypothetical protein
VASPERRKVRRQWPVLLGVPVRVPDVSVLPMAEVPVAAPLDMVPLVELPAWTVPSTGAAELFMLAVLVPLPLIGVELQAAMPMAIRVTIAMF